MRSTDTFENAIPHEHLQDRFEMAWWQPMAGGYWLGDTGRAHFNFRLNQNRRLRAWFHQEMRPRICVRVQLE